MAVLVPSVSAKKWYKKKEVRRQISKKEKERLGRNSFSLMIKKVPLELWSEV